MVTPSSGGSARGPGSPGEETPRVRLLRLLEGRRARVVPDEGVERRAAVVLLLRPGGAGVAGSVAGEPPPPAAAGGQLPERSRVPGGGAAAAPAAASARFGPTGAPAGAFADL